MHYSLKYIVGDTHRGAEIPSRASCPLDPRGKLGFMSKNLKDHPQRSHTLSDCTPFQALLPSYFDPTQLQKYRMWTRSLSNQHLLDAKTAVPWQLPFCLCRDLHSAPFGQWKGGFLGRDENQAMFC